MTELGSDSITFRPAETVGEGTRLQADAHHLPSGDSSAPREYSGRKSLIYRLVAIMLAALFVWFLLLALMLP